MSEHNDIKWQRLSLDANWRAVLNDAIDAACENRAVIGWNLAPGTYVRQLERRAPSSKWLADPSSFEVRGPGWRVAGARTEVWPGGIVRICFDTDEEWLWVLTEITDGHPWSRDELPRVVDDTGTVWRIETEGGDPYYALVPRPEELRIAWLKLPPKQNTARQTDEHQQLIVDALRTLGHDPGHLPENPKRTGPGGGIKQAVREHLRVGQKDERLTPSQFNEAWKALKKSGVIVYTG